MFFKLSSEFSILEENFENTTLRCSFKILVLKSTNKNHPFLLKLIIFLINIFINNEDKLKTGNFCIQKLRMYIKRISGKFFEKYQILNIAKI